MKVELIHRTTGLGKFENVSIDELITGQARISSDRETNDLFKEPEKLLRHCITNQHWSIFSLANLGFYIETSRAMGREILRHSSINPTEFSQRYSSNISLEDVELRLQSKSNRQSSTDKFDPILENWGQNRLASDVITATCNTVENLYHDLIENGVAKETARFILPECTSTQIYLNGTIRSWITFLNARLHKTAQKEVRLVAEQIRDIFIQECPIISASLFNFKGAYEVPILDRVVLEKYKKQLGLTELPF